MGGAMTGCTLGAEPSEHVTTLMTLFIGNPLIAQMGVNWCLLIFVVEMLKLVQSSPVVNHDHTVFWYDPDLTAKQFLIKDEGRRLLKLLIIHCRLRFLFWQYLMISFNI